MEVARHGRTEPQELAFYAGASSFARPPHYTRQLLPIVFFLGQVADGDLLLYSLSSVKVGRVIASQEIIRTLED